MADADRYAPTAHTLSGVGAASAPAPVCTRLVNLTGETLYINTTQFSRAVAPDPCSPASNATGASAGPPLQLVLDGVAFSFDAWTLDGALRREQFSDPAFLARTRGAIVVVRPEHARTISGHICNYDGAADEPRIVSVVGNQLGMLHDSPPGVSVASGLFVKLA